ncbi:MAG: hypothetical protein ABL864_03080 [Terricaulis sp.]
MDQARFEHLLEAYGADYRRWPADERAAAAAFVGAEHVAIPMQQARSLDAALDGTRVNDADTSLLAARILAFAPKRQRPAIDRYATWALAACALFGIAIGYGGGMFAPLAGVDEAYFVMALESPFDARGEEG